MMLLWSYTRFNFLDFSEYTIESNQATEDGSSTNSGSGGSAHLTPSSSNPRHPNLLPHPNSSPLTTSKRSPVLSLKATGGDGEVAETTGGVALHQVFHNGLSHDQPKEQVRKLSCESGGGYTGGQDEGMEGEGKRKDSDTGLPELTVR